MNPSPQTDFQDPNTTNSTGAPLRDNADTRTGISVSQWEKVQEHILKLLHLQGDWDGEGAPPIQPDLIWSALRLTEQLMSERDDAPRDVYPLPGGTIILEWQHPGGIIERIEIEEVGRGEIMTTYPNAPAEFAERTWPPRAPACPPDEVARNTFSRDFP